VVGYDANDDGVLEVQKSNVCDKGYEADQLGAGTTAKPALQEADRRLLVALLSNEELCFEASLAWHDQVNTPIPLE